VHVPPAPINLSPSGAASTSQIFTWTGDAGATSYQLYIAGVINTTYAAAALGCGAGGTCTTPAITLPAGTSLTWRVAGINATGEGAWASAPISVPGTPAPPAPSNLAPSGSASTSQVFTWTGDAGATSYQLYIAGVINTTYTTATLGCSAGGTCTTPAVALPPGSNFTWYVAGINATGEGSWANTSISTPGTPVPPAPSNLAPSGSASTSQVFTWTGDAGATSYQLYIAGVINTTYTTSTLGCASGGTCTTPAVTLPAGTSLTWRVAGINAVGEGAWASASITVPGTPVPPAPTNLSPTGSASTSQAFSWTGDAGATSYQLYIAGVINATYATSTLGCASGGTCTTPSIALSSGSNLTWSVRGINATGDGAFANASITVSGGGGSGLVSLASGENNPIAVAVDSTSVYWTDSNGIKKAAIGGGSATTLATSSGYNLAVDATNVYWTTAGGAVMKVGIGGGSATTLVSSGGQGNTFGIAIDSTYVYWTAQSAGPPNSGTVCRVAIAGGGVTTLASGLSRPQGIAVNSSSVYWTNPSDGTVVMMAIGGGMTTTIASPGNTTPPTAITLDATSVYWTQSNAVVKAPLFGGSTTTLGPANVGEGIAVDSTNVYWTSAGGGSNSTVTSVPLGGGVPTTLYTGGFPGGVAVDATNIYWADSENPGAVYQFSPK
jgi:hypothetical protein